MRIFFLDASEKLLSVTSDLSPRSCANVILNLLPISLIGVKSYRVNRLKLPIMNFSCSLCDQRPCVLGSDCKSAFEVFVSDLFLS